MKRLSTGLLAALIAAGLGVNAVAAPSSASHGNIGTNAIAQAAGSATKAPPANFGSPPSGRIPILYNDHHVYSKPNLLTKGRVLSALVKGGTLLIPLRSMFEQMGATVKYNAGTKSVTISKPGAQVKVTVGKPVVMINGESRPLDVPPIMYKGQVLVPIRVISEGMGAYVKWVASRHLVVVRYIPPAPPAAPPTPAPAMTPVPPTPTPMPIATPYKDFFVSGDYIISPKVYNEFSAGTSNNNRDGFSYQIDGAKEFNAFSLPWMLEGNFRQINYLHTQTAASTPANVGQICNGLGGHASSGDPGCVTGIGGGFQTFVPAFTVRNYDFDVRLGLRVLTPRIYIGVGYLFRSNNAGYPRLSNLGVGVEKLPDLNHRVSFYGNAWYYPNIKGNYSNPSTPTLQLAYNYLKYELGAAYSFKNSPLFFDAGFLGDNAKNKINAPIDETANGAFVGLGLKF